jgi:hypothetical protein
MRLARSRKPRLTTAPPPVPRIHERPPMHDDDGPLILSARIEGTAADQRLAELDREVLPIGANSLVADQLPPIISVIVNSESEVARWFRHPQRRRAQVHPDLVVARRAKAGAPEIVILRVIAVDPLVRFSVCLSRIDGLMSHVRRSGAIGVTIADQQGRHDLGLVQWVPISLTQVDAISDRLQAMGAHG